MIEAFRKRTTSSHNTAAATVNSDNDEGVVRIGLPALIALHRAAESLTLKPGRIRALASGAYHSPFKGRGMEFDEVRPYMQGDDVRILDWRVTARTGRPHTKLFREERERSVLLWLDLRASMFFATRGAYKAVRAAQAAALLGWSAVRHGDRLGALLFSEQSHVELRPKRGKPPLLHLLRRIAEHDAWQVRAPARAPGAGAEALTHALSRLRRVAQPGSLITLLSDFAQLDGQGSAHLVQLARHNDLILAKVHDPLEAELPPPGRYRVSDGENSLSVAAGDPNYRQRYRQRFAQQQEQLQQLCRRHGMSLLTLATAEEPLAALQRGMGVGK